MLSFVRLALAAALLPLLPSVASAQDASLAPNFGQTRLRAGFTPDPHTVSLTAGGDRDADRLGGACTGSISDAPDYRVTYTAGDLPLVFRTVSSTDTTLVINGPDGAWRCDDDSFGDGDAEVRFSAPRSGVYDIWVGTFGGGVANATLLVTETP